MSALGWTLQIMVAMVQASAQPYASPKPTLVSVELKPPETGSPSPSMSVAVGPRTVPATPQVHSVVVRSSWSVTQTRLLPLLV